MSEVALFAQICHIVSVICTLLYLPAFFTAIFILVTTTKKNWDLGWRRWALDFFWALAAIDLLNDAITPSPHGLGYRIFKAVGALFFAALIVWRQWRRSHVPSSETMHEQWQKQEQEKKELAARKVLGGISRHIIANGYEGNSFHIPVSEVSDRLDLEPEVLKIVRKNMAHGGWIVEQDTTTHMLIVTRATGPITEIQTN